MACVVTGSVTTQKASISARVPMGIHQAAFHLGVSVSRLLYKYTPAQVYKLIMDLLCKSNLCAGIPHKLCLSTLYFHFLNF